jgi:hypothetical protein
MPVLQIPVVKAGSKDQAFLLDIDVDKISDVSYQEALRLGLKELANRGMSKLTKAAFDGDEAKLRAAAEKVAQTNLDNINSGNIRVSGGKKKVATGAIATEALRLAKALVKKGLKAQGFKVSEVKTSDITRLAKEYLDTDGGSALMDKAKANIAEREATPVEMDFKALNVQIDDKKVQANAKKKAEGKTTLSAKQAGKPATRSKKGAKPGKEARA